MPDRRSGKPDRRRRRPVLLQPVRIVDRETGIVLVTKTGVILSFLTLAVIFVVQGFLLGRNIQQNHRLAVEGATAHTALCVLKRDYESRLRAGTAFLKNNPNGIPGIPASVIRQSNRSLRDNVEALHALMCS